MNLRFIRDLVCPVCGCTTIVAESIRTDPMNMRLLTHVNGGLWESRQFLCGQVLEYIPNFERTQLSGHRVCTNNVTYKLEQKQIDESKALLIQFIDSLPLTDSRKDT